MTERPPSAPRLFGLFGRKQPPAYQPWDEAVNQERAAGLAILKERRRNERDEQRLVNLIRLWPVGVGLVLSAFSPLIKMVAEASGPWAVTLIFPFVVLAERPEMHVGPITNILPTLMLYAQFPVEGLLARIILRKPVLPISVALQVMLFHFLGVVEVWLLNGVGQRMLPR